MVDAIIRKEEREDYFEVENLTREAFWNVYKPGCVEHYVLHRFRNDKDFIKDLSLVMIKEGKIIGHIMYAKANIKTYDGKTIDILTFGPLSVLPEYQRKGYGKKLLDYSLDCAKKLGYGAICITGNLDFYGKSGFVVASTKSIHHRDIPKEEVADFFLLKELNDGYLKGISGEFAEPDGYVVNEQEVEEFDKKFPYKEKLKLPGQIF